MIMSCTDLDFLPASNPHRIESSGWDDYSVPAGSTDEGDYPLASPGRIRVGEGCCVALAWFPARDVLHSSICAVSCWRRKARVVDGDVNAPSNSRRQ
jgi:hypothetical protein